MEREKYEFTDDETVGALIGRVITYHDTVKEIGEELFNVDDCVEYVLKGLTKWYCQVCFIPLADLPEADARIIDEIKERIAPKVREEVMSEALKIERRLTSRKLKSVTSEAAIRSALTAAGFKFQICTQCYRAWVWILLTDNRILKLPIKYNDVLNGKLDDIVRNIVDVTSILNRMGRDIKVWQSTPYSCSNGWEPEDSETNGI